MGLGTIQTVALILGIVLGGLIILVVLGITIKNAKFPKNASIILLIGAILMGMSIWTSVKVKLPGDIVVELEQKLEETERIMADINKERNALLAEVKILETNINQISKTAAAPVQLKNIRNGITDIRARNSSIAKHLKAFDSVNEVAKADLEKLKKYAKFKKIK